MGEIQVEKMKRQLEKQKNQVEKIKIESAWEIDTFGSSTFEKLDASPTIRSHSYTLRAVRART